MEKMQSTRQDTNSIRFEGKAWLMGRETSCGTSLTVIRHLGDGGSANAFLVKNSDEQRFVLKLFDGYTDDLRRLEREFQVGVSHDSPNLVRIRGLGEAWGLPAMLLEYLPGADLSDMLGDTSVTLPAVFLLQVLRDVLRGLAVLEEAGIIHRDVKPENIRLLSFNSDEGRFDPEAMERAVLLDYGIARITKSERLTMPGSIFGTPKYMAPEQVVGSAETGTDMWSLGVTLLVDLLHGLHPYGINETTSDREAFVSCQVAAYGITPFEVQFPRGRYPSWLEERFVDLIAACLNRKAAARPGAAHLLPFVEAWLAYALTEERSSLPVSGTVEVHRLRAETLKSIRPSPPSEVVVVAPAHQLPIPPSALSRSSWMWLVVIILLAMIAVTLIVIAATIFSRSPPI